MATAADGQRAHDILLSFEPLSRKGACWYYVWQAYAAAGASTGMGSTPTAYKGWEVSLGKHPGDRNPPPGAAIWLGRRYSDGNMDGDVFIAGQYDGDHAATDQPSWLQTGVTSIQGRMNLTGREYLGWTDHVCDAPIILGGGQPAQGNQRQAGVNGCKARRDPSTSQPPVDDKFLNPYDIGTFDGWIHGQSVEGNDVWFRGAYSQLFFWSGGFTDTGTHDLADLNPVAPPAGNSRTVGPNGVNGRGDPSTSGPVTQFLAAGSTWPFDGWIYGESVQGNNVWIRGANSGDYFWSGGFTDVGTHDLADLNPDPEPEPPAQLSRTVGANSSNVRDVPWTSSPAVRSEPSGAEIPVEAYAHAEPVQGNDIWIRRAADGDWQWSGGFTDTSTTGLSEVVAPPQPHPSSPLNPLGLPEYTPVYPRAVIGLEAPLGFVDCVIGGVRASRKQKGSPPVPTTGIIDRFIFHWAWPPGDDTRLFSSCNSGGSCPTQYIFTDATSREFIRPGAKPASTGKEWNWRSWAVEIEPINDGTDPDVPPITDAQIDEAIEQIIFLREHDGGELDGAPVEFKIDAEHIIADRDTRQTECPGDYLYDRIPWIIEEAQRRYDERHPEPTPDTVSIPRDEAEEVLAAAEYTVKTMREALGLT